MIETDLGKVLNYMKQYVENKYEHDSEPMLNYKDLQLVLEEIKRLNNIINEFEDWLNAKYEEMHDIWYVKVLNKLKELKGIDLTEKDKRQIKGLKEEFKIGDKE